MLVHFDQLQNKHLCAHNVLSFGSYTTSKIFFDIHHVFQIKVLEPNWKYTLTRYSDPTYQPFFQIAQVIPRFPIVILHFKFCIIYFGHSTSSFSYISSENDDRFSLASHSAELLTLCLLLFKLLLY